MRCQEVYRWLQAYLDTAVTAEEERIVERHVRSCLACRKRLIELARTVEALEGAEDLTPRQDFTVRLWERLKQEKSSEKRG